MPPHHWSILVVVAPVCSVRCLFLEDSLSCVCRCTHTSTHPTIDQAAALKQAIERVFGGEAWLLRGGITMAATVMKQEMRPNGGPRVSNYSPSSRTPTTDKVSLDSRSKTFQQVRHCVFIPSHPHPVIECTHRDLLPCFADVL